MCRNLLIDCLSIFLLLITSSAQDYRLPGYLEAVDTDQGSVDRHSIRYSDNGRAIQVPKGVFHYVESGQNFEGGFKLPNPGEELDPMRMISELMQTASKAQNDKKTMSGIYVPMPFGMRPLNLQISQSGSNSIGFEDEARPPTPEGLRRKEPKNKKTESMNMSPEARDHLESARLQCIGDDVEECDQALDGYFRARFGASPMDKVKRRADAVPQSPDQIAQTELASWLLPSLRERLDEIQREDEEEVENNEVSAHPSRRRRAYSRRYADSIIDRSSVANRSPTMPILIV
ncbi:hypothetical protein PRIPAC_83157 [Pristionchus pacificus]|uniref:Uncharacterized protein n=1 Tax=Pristionchus pacificus TaxID=54126 RepID=A0A2A6BM50_PRIPA|nr:hypothetical protein PRIPAC_83157 [Pristionchus pacificus]|eukprot:PDM66883.1 hypothetical protein PRIPAC_48300 [Pristionchus pacificus]